MAALTVAACQDTLEEKAAKEVKMFTRKNCPAQIDETIMMDSLTFDVATRTINYHYTLMGRSDTAWALTDEQARQALLPGLKNTTTMMAYKEAGYNFAYIYRSQTNPRKIIFKTTFTKKDYANEPDQQQ